MTNKVTQKQVDSLNCVNLENDVNSEVESDANSARDVLEELIVGIIIFAVLQCVVGFFISSDFMAYIVGTFLGSCTAVIFYIHLFHSLDKALDMDEKGAVRYTRQRTIIRMIIMGTVVVVAFTFYEHVNVVMTFIGIMNAKFSAYLQPFVHKYILKR